jgi:hypothetical protein
MKIKISIRGFILKPIFLANNFINERVEKVNIPLVREIIGGFMIIYLAIHYLLYYYILKTRWDLLSDREDFYVIN